MGYIGRGLSAETPTQLACKKSRLNPRHLQLKEPQAAGLGTPSAADPALLLPISVDEADLDGPGVGLCTRHLLKCTALEQGFSNVADQGLLLRRALCSCPCVQKLQLVPNAANRLSTGAISGVGV